MDIADYGFICEWNNKLIKQLESCENKADIENAFQKCSAVCFKKNGFAEKLKELGSLSAFLDYFQNELGWTVSYDKKSGEILCFENNTECLCPIVKAGCNSPLICRCTQGEIDRMFNFGTGLRVHTEIIHSIIKDGKSCVYKVVLKQE